VVKDVAAGGGAKLGRSIGAKPLSRSQLGKARRRRWGSGEVESVSAQRRGEGEGVQSDARE
jgi:hypothetical protein